MHRLPSDDGSVKVREWERWMEAVDMEVQRLCGMSADDLADYAYRDAYDDGADPAEVAREALAADGACSDCAMCDDPCGRGDD
jgi:hypothetical protein